MPAEHSLYDDAELYDRIVAPPTGSVDFYVALARAARGDVLELACGTGRLAIPVAQVLASDHGARVTGLDLAPAMLDAARAKAAAAGVTIELIQGDMRDFALGRRFALIFVAFNSLLHLTTNEVLGTCFERVREHLAPGGTFAFDLFNPSIAMLARSPDERTTVTRIADPTLGEVHVEATVDYDAATQVNRGTWHFSTPVRPNFLTVPLHMRCIFPQELPSLLAAHGLRLDSRYGDFGREPFASESPRQLCLCRADDTTPRAG